MKDKIVGLLGGFGYVLYYLFSLAVYIFPFVMIGTSFITTMLFLFIQQFFPPVSLIFWIWGLVCAINGSQDVWAYAYYILFIVGFLPFFIGIASDFLKVFKK